MPRAAEMNSVDVERTPMPISCIMKNDRNASVMPATMSNTDIEYCIFSLKSALDHLNPSLYMISAMPYLPFNIKTRHHADTGSSGP